MESLVLELFLFPPWIHTLSECLAFFIAGRLFWHLRKKESDTLTFEDRIWVIAGCSVGALLGAKVIALLDTPTLYTSSVDPLMLISGGKGIVGALGGGWLGVELVKKLFKIQQKSGDLFVYPLIAGMIIGRIGCFLTGFYDKTYGIATSLPWGIDFGDGIVRHPIQLYEIGFLIGLAVFLRYRLKYPSQPGEGFRLFIFSYCLFRFWVDFLKPTPHLFWGLNANQIACILMMMGAAPYPGLFIPSASIRRLSHERA